MVLVACMEEVRIQQIILVLKSVGKNHPTRPEHRWCITKTDLKEMGGKLWMWFKWFGTSACAHVSELSEVQNLRIY